MCNVRPDPAPLIVLVLTLTSSILLAAENSLRPTEGVVTFALVGGHISGHGKASLIIRNGRIAQISKSVADNTLPLINIEGKYVAAGFIDSHVHFAYKFGPEELAAGGIVAAVDLAAPLAYVVNGFEPLHVIFAGPMITARKGYPTQSWGSDGYGLEVDDVQTAREAVDHLHALGARVIKVPVGDASGKGTVPVPFNKSDLSDIQLQSIVERAHSYGMKVAAHAITDNAAHRAALAGADILAHTPTELLKDSTVQEWSGRAVISRIRKLAAYPDANFPS